MTSLEKVQFKTLKRGIVDCFHEEVKGVKSK